MATVRRPLMFVKCAKTYNCCSFIDNTMGRRNISRSSKTGHYDSLGITPKATQSDVKAAYYKLSMVYHPDKNEGCSDAANKFRDISAAYEILGNYKLRRLYDKGIVHTAGPQYRDVDQTVEETEPDDPQTRFYKQHMKRTETPHASGKTPIYNFDEWNNEHYGKAFERSQAARKRFKEKPNELIHEAQSVKNEIVILGGMVGLTLALYLVVMHDAATADQSYARKKLD